MAEPVPLIQLVEKPTWRSILFDLVARGRVNPWDVDIAVVVESFLEHMKKMERLNLYVSGNLVLATSILLKLKALQLSFEEEEEEEEIVVEGVEVREPPVMPLPKARPITVQELVEAVERAMEKVKRAKPKEVREAPQPPPPMITFEEEKVEEKIERLYHRLKEMGDVINLTSLIRQEQERVEQVRILLYSLFLANEGRLQLWQVEPFKDILAKVVG